MAKYHFLTGDDLAALPIEERIARCVEIKADVVADDERESEGRALLNYGHTLAHALETAGRYDLRHGEAVGIGLVYAAELAHHLGRIDADRVAEHRAVVSGYELPDRLPAEADGDELLTLVGRDKKALGAVTFVLDGPVGLEIVRGIDHRDLVAALEAHHMTSPIVLLLSGPNLNLLGQREPQIYGSETLDDHVATCRTEAERHGLTLEHLQSNHEGVLIEAVHGARSRAAAIIINAGAFSHYSWAIHDALVTFDGPIVELHLSNPYAARRGGTRRSSLPSSTGSIVGFKGSGYRLAAQAVASLLEKAPS